ncbi:hypothetical protein NAL19_3646 [Pectobacterium sp. F1-1]|nr:hypothetical protein NAL19_3646 [Pectobacterium sp. F1-1]
MACGVRECERHNEEGEAVFYTMCVSSRFYAAFLFYRPRGAVLLFLCFLFVN